MVLFVLPGLIDGTATKCRGALPANAYLFNGARTLGERLSGESKTHYPGALAALEKLAGDKMPRELTEDSVRKLISEGFSTDVLNGVKPDMCDDINEAAELLAPLPPENLGGLVTMLARLGFSGQKKKTKGPNICAATR